MTIPDTVWLTGPMEERYDQILTDLEGANAPLWTNVIGGQVNLRDAVERRIDFTSADGKAYPLDERTTAIVVRPRGWHLPEARALFDMVLAGDYTDFLTLPAYERLP